MPSNIHDALFKATFSQVEHAAGELRQILPAGLLAHLDFATLALCPGSFVDEAFSQRHSDLLFSVKLAGREAFLYILFEHQSKSDRLMLFRMLRYMVRIWETWLKGHPRAERLPAIVPVLLHHSADGWTAEVSFEALLDVDAEVLSEIAAHVPRFQVVLDDISAQSDESLQARAMSALGRLSLWCLKTSRDTDQLLERFVHWAETVREVGRAPNGMAALAMVFRYIWEAHERISVAALQALVAQEVGKDVEEAIMTTADLLREEGHKRGRKEGLKDGQREMLLRLLGVRFGALPEDVVTRVNAAEPATLNLWAERVLTAPTLAEVLGDP